jgi:hypothetical protein
VTSHPGVATWPGWVSTMADPRQAGLDPAHILAICARATGGRRGLAVRKADGIIVCILPSRRTAYRASTALARVGYEVTSVSASRGRDLLVTGWDPATLESRLTTMRRVMHQLADNPPLTANAVIERFRSLPAESRTRQHQWELLNRASIGLRGWVTTRSGIHVLRDSTIQSAEPGIAVRLRATAALERAIDEQVERQLQVAGHALALFRHLSGQTDGDSAKDAAIRWASITFHLSSSTTRDPSSLMPHAAGPALGANPADHEAARTLDPSSRPAGLPTDLLTRPRPGGWIAAEFPRAALTPGRPGNVVSLDSARRRTRPSPMPRLRP